MTTQQKIIGRFEPIGEEVGPKRVPFDVLTKEPVEALGICSKPGFKGLAVLGESTFEYSVVSEHWQFVPVEQECSK